METMVNNMIAWAESRMGDADYAGWCLSFIEDALEISNGIEIFGGDSAKESCEMYRDALHTGIPERGAFVFYDCLCPSEDGPVNWGHCGIALDGGRVIHAWDKVRIDGYREIEQLTALTGDHPKYLGWVPISRVLVEKAPDESIEKGATPLNVTYEHKNTLTLIGFHTEIRPDEGYQKCPEFWDREYNEKYARLWQTMKPETPVEAAILENGIGMYAICADAEDSFTYWIAGLYKGGEVPEGLDLYTFPESDWAVFSAKGPLPGSLQALNTAVWQDWFPNEGQKYSANGNATLEVYSAGDPQSPDYECGIWVPLKK